MPEQTTILNWIRNLWPVGVAVIAIAVAWGGISAQLDGINEKLTDMKPLSEKHVRLETMVDTHLLVDAHTGANTRLRSLENKVTKQEAFANEVLRRLDILVQDQRRGVQ